MQRLLLIHLLAGSVAAAIREDRVAYPAGSADLTGYLAYDDAWAEKRPGVLMVHEWWGATTTPGCGSGCWRCSATPLWRSTCTAKQTAAHPDDAGKFVTAEQIAAFRRKMATAGVDFRFIGYPNARHGFTDPETSYSPS